MKKNSPFCIIIISIFVFFACGASYNARAKEAPQAVGSIDKAQLVGSWKCIKFVFDNGMQSPLMAKHEPVLAFSGDGIVTSGARTYKYEIHGNKVLFSRNGKPVGKTYLYDGKNLILQGDNAKVFYEKVK